MALAHCDIIVTYCWNRVGYNIMKSLASHGLKVWVADTSKVNICSLSKYCSGSFVYPDPFTEEDAFISCIKQKVQELCPSMLLPTHDESIILMRHRDEFPSDLIIPYENDTLLSFLSNKTKSSQLAANLGVPIPKLYSSVDEVSLYPVVVKTVIGNSAKGVFFPLNKEELLSICKKLEGEDTLIEEYINGTDYSVDCVRWNGFWKASVYKALVTKTYDGGTTTQRQIVDFPIMESYAKQILDSVDFHGVCGLDFRYNSEHKKIAYIETNARFTGGLATPICAGFDIPWVLYNLALKGYYIDPIDVKIGVKTKWLLGDIITLVGRLLSFKWNSDELKKVFKISGFDAYDDYSKDDELAILGEFAYYLKKLLINRRLNP